MNPWDRLIRLTMTHRWPALAAAAAIAAAGAAFAPGIPFTSEITEYLPRGSPTVASWLDLSRRFDAFNALVVGLEEPEAPLTAEGLNRLARITTRLGELKAKGVLVARSVTNIDSLHEATDGALETSLLIPEVPEGKAELEELSRRISADLQVSGSLISRDQRGYAILLRSDPRRDSADVARLVQKVVEEERGPLAAYYFGAPFFTTVITKKVYAQVYWIAPVFAVLLLGVLAVSVRRASVVAIVLVGAGLSLLTWLGMERLLGPGLTRTSLNALLVLLVVAAVAFARGLEARLGSQEPDANPFPASILAGLAAIGLACLALSQATLAYLAAFGAAMAVGAAAVALVGVLFVAPLATFVAPRLRQPTGHRRAFSPAIGLAFATVVLAVAGLVASRGRFLITPQAMFSEHDEVGQALAFFDRRFGGNDFIQVDFTGDLRDPAVAARLMRLTDLVEGAGAFADVRSVAQVLGFLAHGFGGVHRVPTTRESLGSLWFFLEGSSDVRNLVSDARDEAMVLVRVPSKLPAPVTDLVAIVDATNAESAKPETASAKARLLGLARAFRQTLQPDRIDQVLAAAVAPMSEEERLASDLRVASRLRAWAASDDSPYRPSDEAWPLVQEALAADGTERRARLAQAAGALPGLSEGGLADRFVETMLARERDLRLADQAAALAERLWTDPVSEAVKVRARGVLADVLDQHASAGEAATVTVSGLPVVAEQVQRDLAWGLWRSLGVLLALGALVLLALTRSPRRALRAFAEAAVSTGLVLAICTALGFEIDAGSATLYLLPPLAALLASDRVGLAGREPEHARLPAAFLAGLGASGVALVLVGVLPVARIGAAMVIGCATVALVNHLSGLFRTAR